MWGVRIAFLDLLEGAGRDDLGWRHAAMSQLVPLHRGQKLRGGERHEEYFTIGPKGRKEKEKDTGKNLRIGATLYSTPHVVRKNTLVL